MKITVIGAGSAVFSLTIIRDICLTPILADCEVCLMDRDARRLEAAHLLCVRYAAEIGMPLRISRTLDRREALENADFVINTAACGHEMLIEGWEIAARHGYRFGGSLHIMHDEAFWANHCQLELIESVYEDMLSSSWQWLAQNASSCMMRRSGPTTASSS
jgi:alpha-galactosidase